MSELLTKVYNPDYYSEDEMQKDVEIYLKQKTFYKQIPRPPYRIEVKPRFIREFRIPEVGRISDHIIYFSKRKIINIECKLDNYIEVIAQATDHLRWADYSMICLPLKWQYIPNKYISEIIDKGLGLMYYLKDVGIFQFINPKRNRNKEDKIRKAIVDRIEPLKLAI